MIVPASPLRAAIDTQAKESLRAFYDVLASRPPRISYLRRSLLRCLRFIVPPGSKVLEPGCGDGWLVRQLQPSRGLGIDFSPRMIEAVRAASDGTANVEFEMADIEAVGITEQFDYIILADLLGILRDVQTAMDNIRAACGPTTRVVVIHQNILWEPMLRAAARLGLIRPRPPQNWLTTTDIATFARLCDLEVVSQKSRVLLPIFIPLLSWLANDCLAALPPLQLLCMSHIMVLRPLPCPAQRQASVSVIIPCRNERGTIEEAVLRLPEFGSAQEIIFVNSHSTDGTFEEMQRVKAAYPDRNIKVLNQEDDQGKAGAVRLGFAQATHDLLIILDGDLTVPPEDMPKFFEAAASGRGEFINGSRMVYPMETGAMRTLNTLANRFFSAALSLLIKQEVKDTLCGTKAVWQSDYRQIAAGRGLLGGLDPFGDFDLLLGAARLNLKIADVPVRYWPRVYGKTNIRRFRDGWMLFRMTLRAYWRFNR